MPESARGEFLDEACQDRPELRRNIERLLIADQQNQQSNFLDWPASELDEGGGQQDPLVGREVLEYRIVELLGRGANGVVYRAVQVAAEGDQFEGADQSVAIKFLPAWHQDEDGSRRFRQEIELLEKVDHPNVAKLVTSGVLDGMPFLVMEYIQGQALNRVLSNDRPNLKTRVKWFFDICHAIAAAHRERIIHRDLKPSNILIAKEGPSQEGHAVVTDFGIAKSIDPEREQVDLTATGNFLGTPRFMAPEQYDDPRSVNLLTDVYGLGAVLYYLLAGQAPFSDTQLFDIPNAVRKELPAPPSRFNRHVPGDLETICLKCLEKSRADRYQSVPELIDDLVRWTASRPVRARSVTKLVRVGYWMRANPIVTALSALTLVIVMAALAGTTYQWYQASVARRLSERTTSNLIGVLNELAEQEKSYRDNPTLKKTRVDLLRGITSGYEKIEADGPMSTELLKASAVAWYNLARFERGLTSKPNRKAERKSREQFEELNRRHPDDEQYRFDLFHWHHLFGESAKAMQILRDLIADAEQPSPIYNDCLATACYECAQTSFQKGELDAAIRFCDEGIETALANVEAAQLEGIIEEKPLTQLYYLRATNHLLNGQMVEGRQDAVSALYWADRVYQQHPEVWESADFLANCVILNSKIGVADGDMDQVEKFAQRLDELKSTVDPQAKKVANLWGSKGRLLLNRWIMARHTGDDATQRGCRDELKQHLDLWQATGITDHYHAYLATWFYFLQINENGVEWARERIDGLQGRLSGRSPTEFLMLLLDGDLEAARARAGIRSPELAEGNHLWGEKKRTCSQFIDWVERGLAEGNFNNAEFEKIDTEYMAINHDYEFHGLQVVREYLQR